MVFEIILKIPFHIIGLFSILTPSYWVIQLVHSKIICPEEDFFSERFWRVNFWIGLIEVLLLVILILYLYSIDPSLFEG